MSPEAGGDLQRDTLSVLWALGEADVNAARAALEARGRDVAYTTTQTVLNRLVARGLAERERVGRSFIYRPTEDEASYVKRVLLDELHRTSPDVARRVLAELKRSLPS